MDVHNIAESMSEETISFRKKRGRHLLSDELETYLLNRIRSERESCKLIPDRIWVVREAKFFINKNKIDLKCSKGWLDKFMKRNASVINQRITN